MKHAIKTFTLFILLLFSNASIGYAQDLAQGAKAYVRGDYAEALRQFKPLAEKGDPITQLTIGNMYYLGQGVTQDYKTAVKWYRLAAEQGDAHAQFNLGLMYYDGLGVTQNDKTGVKWYRLAAEQGHARAQINLGGTYYNGRGVIQNYVLAHMWFNIAASNGNTLAIKSRTEVASKMTSADISKAQRMARECVENNYQGC